VYQFEMVIYWFALLILGSFVFSSFGSLVVFSWQTIVVVAASVVVYSMFFSGMSCTPSDCCYKYFLIKKEKLLTLVFILLLCSVELQVKLLHKVLKCYYFIRCVICVYISVHIRLLIQ
jgi:hypothetical protein